MTHDGPLGTVPIDSPSGPPSNELRERTILPVLIPVAAILVTEIVVFSLSRVLLAAGERLAVVVAFGASLGILIGATAIAGSRRMRTSSIAGLLAIALIGVVAAGALALQRGPAYVREAAADRPVLKVSAKNIAFSTKTLELSPAGSVIEFNNADTQPHNIAIFGDESMTKVLFRGQILQPGQKANYEVGQLKPGKYRFHCDVHPNMTGEAIVDAGKPKNESSSHASERP